MKKISEVMTTDVQTVSGDQTAREAAGFMLRAEAGSIPVCEGDKVIGIITDRDITVRAVARGLDPNQTKVHEVMTRDVLACPADSEIEAACELMEKRQVRRLLVTGDDETPVGIVSLGDIALCLREVQSGEVLKKVSEPG